MSDQDFPVTVYHNPACSTSRKVVGMVRDAGHKPRIVEYLQTGWSLAELRAILGEMGVGAAAILRRRGTSAEELGLLEDGVSEEAILAAMVAHPVLVERPIVRTKLGTVLGRPVEAVLRALPPAM